MEVHGHFIDGRLQAPGQETIPSINPATGETNAHITKGTAADVGRAVDSAHRAFTEDFARTSPPERARLLNKVADVIESRQEALAALETTDNGKLFGESVTQVKAVVKWYRYFAGLADKTEGRTVPSEKPSLLNYTVKVPIGVVGCITPWNSPLLLATWKLAPAFAAGNTVVLKPSEHASLSTLALADCFTAAGFPDGALNVVTGFGQGAGEALVAHPSVGKISFTGSETGGRAIAGATSGRLARITSELGGKSANILFEDCDIDRAVDGLISGVFAAAGQTCMAGSRAVVHSSIYDEVVDRLTARLKTVNVGDPFDEDTNVGPISTKPQHDRVSQLVSQARSEGARVVAGGSAVDRAGYFYQPTIVDNLGIDATICQEEVFGPVMVMQRFDTDKEAMTIANSTRYGLAAGVWTNDLTRAIRCTRELIAGTVWVNTYRAVAPGMPFGGFKSSGVGRENGSGALEEFMETKSIWIETDTNPAPPFMIKA